MWMWAGPTGEQVRHADAAAAHAHDGSPSWLSAVWEQGVLGQSFLVLSAVAALVLVAAMTRSRVSRWIHAPALAAQLQKLIRAGNADRAIKLCHASDAPVCYVALAGLEAARGGVRDAADAGAYRAAPDPVLAARDAMEKASVRARADATYGFLPARVLGVAACVLGGVTASRESDGQIATAVLTVGIACLLAASWALVRSHANAIASIASTVEELASERGMRAQ